ncbi:P-loop NTPase family protein [Candidatus Nanopusillus massiliensis]|uniref:hypothetical protein n=1 Tax=Candidatus Nanopusillus massiliensis TaxID=2897163 RepID=UPI001E4D75F5|nr:hypothetical protein [Candidatus Nanopusillus massiliensis]
MNLLKELEDGALIFIPKEKGVEYMIEIYNYLIYNYFKSWFNIFKNKGKRN